MSPEEQKIKNLSKKYVSEAPYHPGYEDSAPQSFITSKAVSYTHLTLPTNREV